MKTPSGATAKARMFRAITELDDFVNRNSVPLLESKAY
jgi:hypothetical protein